MNIPAWMINELSSHAPVSRNPRDDRELARQLLSTPTGCCTSTAYDLFNKYRRPFNATMGPTDAEIISNLRDLAGEYPAGFTSALSATYATCPRWFYQRVARRATVRRTKA